MATVKGCDVFAGRPAIGTYRVTVKMISDQADEAVDVDADMVLNTEVDLCQLARDRLERMLRRAVTPPKQRKS